MGVWGSEPWNSDESADWFHRFFKHTNFQILISEINDFDPKNENYESFRSACYLLQCLGNPYIWPARHLDELKELLSKAITILLNMIQSPSQEWTYMELCNHDKDFLASIKSQISSLQQRLMDLH